MCENNVCYNKYDHGWIWLQKMTKSVKIFTTFFTSKMYSVKMYKNVNFRKVNSFKLVIFVESEQLRDIFRYVCEYDSVNSVSYLGLQVEYGYRL